MKHRKIYDTAIAALFLAAAIVLPFLTGQLPEIGKMLLPMHIPIMLCGLICGAPWGTAVGFVAPLLRSLLFTQPLLFPDAVAMAVELATYGLVIGLIFGKFKSKNILAIYVSLICAMVCGRVAWCIAMSACLGFSALSLSIFSAQSLLSAVPGIILQLVIIPSVMLVMRRAHVLRDNNKESHLIPDDECKIPLDLVAEIRERAEGSEKLVIAIDGRCGAGKTTLAEALAKKFGASVFHIDDFYLPRNQRSKKRLSECAGNIDRERFIREVLSPLSEGKRIAYRKYNCKTDKIQKKVMIEPLRISIIEGSYALHPDFCSYYDIKIFLDIDPELQRARIIEREGEAGAAAFSEKWIPLEEEYIKSLDVISRCDKIINAIR